MPTLVLMRHGEAGFAARDRARPLTPRGREEAASQARADSFRHSFSTAMAVVGHVESWSSLAPGRMQIVDVLRA